ncbi:MAG: Txe/YoeB family addiction module toxin [Prevotella sp.]|nr:Txe/YoeB family addiction module toxin [Prevotella sp.]
MEYRIKFTASATKDVRLLQQGEPSAYKKLKKFIEELKVHPTPAPAIPHRLTGDRAGQWSRSITKKHRLVYEVHDDEIVVLVLAAYGHYDDH